jgi:hypothetical protein
MYQLWNNDCTLYLGEPNTDFMKKSFNFPTGSFGMK